MLTSALNMLPLLLYPSVSYGILLIIYYISVYNLYGQLNVSRGSRMLEMLFVGRDKLVLLLKLLGLSDNFKNLFRKGLHFNICSLLEHNPEYLEVILQVLQKHFYLNCHGRNKKYRNRTFHCSKLRSIHITSYPTCIYTVYQNATSEDKKQLLIDGSIFISTTIAIDCYAMAGGKILSPL